MDVEVTPADLEGAYQVTLKFGVDGDRTMCGIIARAIASARIAENRACERVINEVDPTSKELTYVLRGRVRDAIAARRGTK